MRPEEQFDSFYLKTRRALVHQTFALTGDLAAAQRAVRDAYVAAWHHWRKVNTYEDPRDWVRPRAWALAQRRHTARLWQRTKHISAEDRAVLDALHKLSSAERRTLLVVELAGVPLDVSARELNVTQLTLERQLRSATATFASRLGIDPADTRTRLLSLAEAASRAHLPRPAGIRRDGATRRRTHTAVAVVVATVLAVGSGAFAHEPGDEASDAPLTAESDAPASSPAPSTSSAPESTLPSADNLLTAQLLKQQMPGGWRVGDTHDNTSGQGLNYVCQQERFADPEGLATLVREFDTTRKSRSMVQVVEISESPEGASRTFDTVLSWFGGCGEGGVHLARAFDVARAGDRATVLELQDWAGPRARYSVAVGQVGQVVTTSVVRTTAGPAPDPRDLALTLATATQMICEQAGETDCGGRPRLQDAAPPASAEERGFLSTVDMPPLQGRARPWVATGARPARRNPAATRCDRAEFRQMGATRARTRTFLEDGSKLPTYFGVTETHATFRSPKQAARALSTIRARFASCEDRDLATEVVAPGGLRQDGLDGSTWRLLTEISEDREIVYDVGFVRRGDTLAQVTFLPAGGADLAPGAFRAMVIRAGVRLGERG